MHANQLTPRLNTLRVPEASWVSIEIGISRGEIGEHLALLVRHEFSPWQSRPVAGRLDVWEAGLVVMRKLWEQYACPRCKGGRVTSDCPDCEDTGWKDWVRWNSGGRRLSEGNLPVF